MADLDTLRPEVREAVACMDSCATIKPACGDGFLDETWCTIRAELLRLTKEMARLSKVESHETEQRLQMEDVELYLMEVSQPDDEDADWCDRMKSAIEGLVQDCNEAVGHKNRSIQRAEKAESERDALRKRIEDAPVGVFDLCYNGHEPGFLGFPHAIKNLPKGSMLGQRVRLVVEE